MVGHVLDIRGQEANLANRYEATAVAYASGEYDRHVVSERTFANTKAMTNTQYPIPNSQYQYLYEQKN